MICLLGLEVKSRQGLRVWVIVLLFERSERNLLEYLA